MESVYNELLKLTPNELGKWQGYGTETTMDGFLVGSKGATGIGKMRQLLESDNQKTWT